MNAIDLQFHNISNSNVIEKKIYIRGYSTSEDLKKCIRKTIADYSKMGWEFVSMHLMEDKKHRTHTILTDENFEKEVLMSPEPILMEIGANWCGTCEIMAPIIEKLAVDYKGKIKFAKLDIETSERVAIEYDVTKLPIFLFYKDGEVVDHIIGAVSKKVLDNRFKALLKT